MHDLNQREAKLLGVGLVDARRGGARVDQRIARDRHRRLDAPLEELLRDALGHPDCHLDARAVQGQGRIRQERNDVAAGIRDVSR